MLNFAHVVIPIDAIGDTAAYGLDYGNMLVLSEHGDDTFIACHVDALTVMCSRRFLHSITLTFHVAGATTPQREHVHEVRS